ncbi:putative bifunctional diguanylate cyclase/phosphodiesterase [Chrysiogenes arsenatis]|uniref:putative bifunctional diguanylate cyclase/phosphodiesterase n=1 Tax=Chrysiogenes arsenatis TaxID=309797 RepID=UPI0003FA03DF|nr:GGDEF domain-containing phosphodiesterase [Chrysiogenes arsenatis]
MKFIKPLFFVVSFAVTCLMFFIVYIASVNFFDRVIVARENRAGQSLEQHITHDLRRHLNTTPDFNMEAYIRDLPATNSSDPFFQVAPLKQAPATLSDYTTTYSGDLLTVHERQGEASYELLYLFRKESGASIAGVQLTHRIAPVLAESNRQYFIHLLYASPIPMVIAWFLTHLFLRRLKRSLGQLSDSIEKANTLKDIKELEFSNVNLGLVELNAVFDQFVFLFSRLRNISIDKSVLEFEMRLLEKFIITSDVIKDWKDFVRALLLDINTIIEAYAMFTIFKIDDDIYEIEVFWRGVPTNETKDLLEKFIRQRIRGNEAYAHTIQVDINHNVCDQSRCLVPLSAEDIELQTKSLLLNAPKIGGTVGIGVQSVPDRDNIRTIVIESVLTTLINVVGSAKALHKYTQEIEYYATRDPLTHLFNQRVFWEMLHYEVKRSERHKIPFSLLVVDCDNFKHINDMHGHLIGDKFLQQFAKIIRTELRNEDILARYGGDEFVAILTGADNNQAITIANRVKEAVAEYRLSIEDASAEIATTVSLGIATFPEHATEGKDLFLIADNMMYRAKSEGKNSIKTPGEEDIIEAFKLAGEKVSIVMAALRERRVIPFMQPIQVTATGEIAIHELLMRIDIDNSMMVAGEFIHVAENMGIIHELDFILMEKAFEIIQRTGYTGKLFVNISPRSFVVGEFLPIMVRLTQKYAIAREQIVFEITERETVKNLNVVEKLVGELNHKGFKFAIDDFGSGFSSFHYLKRFPIDYLKIEGEFICNMHRDPKDHAFVKSIVTLAKELNIETVAEFVEDETTLQLCLALGIDYVQGYHIGRPAPQFTPERSTT